MSESTRRIDARGLPCPKPVLSAKQALEEGGFDRLEVLVDNAAARENVERFARYSGRGVLSVQEEGDTIRILIGAASGAGAAAPAAGTGAAPAAAGGRMPGQPLSATIFIRSERIGTGDDELGTQLMRAYLATLNETEPSPGRLVLMNGGVRLAVQGAQTVESLRKLEVSGVEILVCGTCLKFFGLEDRLAVGRISNMYEIAEALHDGATVTI